VESVEGEVFIYNGIITVKFVNLVIFGQFPFFPFFLMGIIIFYSTNRDFFQFLRVSTYERVDCI